MHGETCIERANESPGAGHLDIYRCLKWALRGKGQRSIQRNDKRISTDQTRQTQNCYGIDLLSLLI